VYSLRYLDEYSSRKLKSTPQNTREEKQRFGQVQLDEDGCGSNNRAEDGKGWSVANVPLERLIVIIIIIIIITRQFIRRMQ